MSTSNLQYLPHPIPSLTLWTNERRCSRRASKQQLDLQTMYNGSTTTSSGTVADHQVRLPANQPNHTVSPPGLPRSSALHSKSETHSVKQSQIAGRNTWRPVPRPANCQKKPENKKWEEFLVGLENNSGYLAAFRNRLLNNIHGDPDTQMLTIYHQPRQNQRILKKYAALNHLRIKNEKKTASGS